MKAYKNENQEQNTHMLIALSNEVANLNWWL